MKYTPSWKYEVGTAGVLAAGPYLWLRAILWATLLSVAAFAFFISTQFLGSWLHLPPNSAYLIVAGVPVLAFIAYAFAVRQAESRVAIEVMPSCSALGDFLIGASIGFVMLCSMLALLWALGLYRVQQGHWGHVLDALLFGPYLSGMMEELLFRAILMRIFARAFGSYWGLALSAILFGAAHLGHASGLAAFEITVNAGVTLGLLYMATGRLWMSIGMHTAWDFTEDSILGVNHHNGLLFSTPIPGKADALTGGAIGPDSSALATIVGLLAIGAILSAQRRGFFQKHVGSSDETR